MQFDLGSLFFGALLLVAGAVLVGKRATIVREAKAREDVNRKRFLKGEYFGQVPVVFSTGTRVTMVTVFCFVVGVVFVVWGIF
ncbi:hypothetical protein [Kineococcus sp. R86509]|uniref:hypothetical protein n=1 Tax=Kineococcus sp. R86509 TaxID=3093851 RepID=UPI0036D2BF45